MFLSNAAIRNRTTVLVLVVLILVAGLFSYFTLPREAAPDVPIPLVMVTTTYEGVSPEDVETAVTMKIEQKLTGLKGVEEIRSTSREGMSLIVIEFQPDVVIEDALQYVRDKVDQAKQDLPNDAEEPTLSEINIAEFPIMLIDLSGPISPVRLKVIAEELEDAIEQVPGVLDSEVIGALEREIRLEFDPDRVAAYGISIPELVSLIPSENVNVSAGGLETPGTKFNVRVPAEFAEPEDIDHLLLTVRDGRPIYLADVATVRDTFKDRATYARLDGQPSVTLTVKKRVGANIVQIADRVKAILDEAGRRLPAGVRVNLTMDQSKDIHLMVADLENNVLAALVLVVGILMLSMGLRTSLIVALVIPLSMLMSFSILQAMGVTLNMIVLFSLVLALGMLVDNAVVIVENIYRFMHEGHGRLEAARQATAEVAWPVITSTLTTVAAFAPLLLWQGVMGDFMKYLPITVIVVLSSSMFVALVVNPVVASVLIKLGRMNADGTLAPPRGFDAWRQRVEDAVVSRYRRLLRVCLASTASRVATLGLALLSLAAAGVLYAKYNRGLLFFPDIDPARAMVSIRGPQGTNIEHTNRLAELVERRVEAQRADLEHVSTSVGAGEGSQNIFGEGATGPHMATVTLIFHDFLDRPRPSMEVIREVRQMLRDIPGAEVKVEKERHGPPTGGAVEVRVIGEDFAELARLSEQARHRIEMVSGLVGLRSDYEASRPELQFIPDRQRAMLLKVNTDLIGQFLKTALFGREVGIYRQFNDEYDITVRLPVGQRTNIDDLLRLNVPNADGDPVPLSNLGTFVYRGGYGDIHRVDQKRVITLSADVEGRRPEEALADVQAQLKDVQPPPGYAFQYAGEREEQEKATAFLGKAYLIAILAILLILVAQFNTLGVPVVIMVTVLLSLIGVLIGLLVTGTSFVVIMTGIGVVSLAGVVVNNAIVLLDYTRQLERRGLSLIDAAVQAGVTRLRPVYLTAVTTIIGLVPMSTGISFDFHTFEWVARSETSQWWAPMANAVIFGLGFATILTLVVVPSMYVLIYAGLERLGLGGLKRAGEAGAAPRADNQ